MLRHLVQHKIHDVDAFGLWAAQLLSYRFESSLEPGCESPMRPIELQCAFLAARLVIDSCCSNSHNRNDKLRRLLPEIGLDRRLYCGRSVLIPFRRIAISRFARALKESSALN